MTRSPLLPDGPTPPVRTLRFRRLRLLLASTLGIGLVGIAMGLIGAWGIYLHISANLPSVESLQHYHPPVVSRLYTHDDRLMAELSHERRIYIPITAIPARVKNAFIAAEDQNFYNHGGIDYLAILRAGVTDLLARHGRRPLGASTITQQVAKVVLLNNNHVSFTRKAREAMLALRIERTLSKDRILEIYLNGIYLGNGAYGVAAAAQTYFNKSLDELDNAEAAMLGALPKSPTNYNPFLHPQTALWRRNWVLGRMLETRAISEEEEKTARAEPLVPQKRFHFGPMANTEWFSEEVRRELIAQYGEDQALEGGLDVHTSLDPRLQSVSLQALRDGLMSYDRAHEGWHGVVTHIDLDSLPPPASDTTSDAASDDWAHRLAGLTPPPGMLDSWRLAVILSPGHVGWIEHNMQHRAVLRPVDVIWSNRNQPPQPGDVVMIRPQDNGKAILEQIPHVEGATVTMDTRTGRVLALVGGWSFAESQFNRATQALRQPGSSFKPLVYLAAMERNISPSETFDDAPIEVGDWRPQNYEHDNWGATTLHDALRESRNLVTIRVAAWLGMDAVGAIAVKSGLVDKMPPYLPAALGAIETTVLREAGAYAAIANGGHVVTPSLIDTIQDPDGRIIWRTNGLELAPDKGPENTPLIVDKRPVLASPQSTYQIATMMRDVIAHGTGFRAGVGISQPVAGKTGTSQDYHDAWFAGFSPDLVTIVWIGYDTPRSLGRNETGGRVAGPIWNIIMKAAFHGRPDIDFPAPPNTILAHYNTGRIPAVDAFKDGQIPGASIPLRGFGSGTQSLTASDTGADIIPDSENDMSSMEPPSPDGTTSSNIGDDTKGTVFQPLPPGIPPGAFSSGNNASTTGGSQNVPHNNEGDDIGVGGLY